VEIKKTNLVWGTQKTKKISLISIKQQKESTATTTSAHQISRFWDLQKAKDK
jgi:hypothetical protein